MSAATQAQAAPKRALLVIDVQNEYFTGNMPIAHPDPQTSQRNIGAAMDAARAAGIPILVVQHSAAPDAPIFAPGTPAWELHEVVKTRAYDYRIEKNMASIFAGTDAAVWLGKNGIDTLTVAGYMTHNCNASTIYQAAHEGYQVEMLSDASGSLPYANAAGSATAEEIHRVFSVVFHSNFAAVCSTADWIAAVQSGRALEKSNVLASHLAARMGQTT